MAFDKDCDVVGYNRIRIHPLKSITLYEEMESNKSRGIIDPIVGFFKGIWDAIAGFIFHSGIGLGVCSDTKMLDRTKEL